MPVGDGRGQPLAEELCTCTEVDVQLSWARSLHKSRERREVIVPIWRGHVQLIDGRVDICGEAVKEGCVQVVDERRSDAGRQVAKPWQAVSCIRPTGLHKGGGQQRDGAAHPVGPCRYGGGTCRFVGAKLSEDLIAGAEATQVG